MADEKIFADGFSFKTREGQPDFVVGRLSIKVEDALTFLKERADKGKKKAPKKKAPPVPPRPAGRPGARSFASVAAQKTRVGQTKGRISNAVAGSLTAARRKKQAQSNPSAGYA